MIFKPIILRSVLKATLPFLSLLCPLMAGGAPSAQAASGKIVFDSERAGNREIYVMNADGSNQTRLTSNGAADYLPCFNADGSKIVFNSTRNAVTYNGQNEIYVMNPDGTNQTRLTSNTAMDGEACFSPDGSKIAFESDRTGHFEIYVMDATGANQTRVTFNNGLSLRPTFNADGSKIAFCYAPNSSSDLKIYVINVDGTNQTLLTPAGLQDIDCDYSPDGSKLTFGSGATNSPGQLEIYVSNADGTNRTRLTNNSADDYNPFFSPGGNRITFQSNRDGNDEIYVMNADGTNQTRLTNNSVIDASPSWAPGQVTPSGLVVNTLSDVADAADGLTSLREAITFANAQVGTNTITFDATVFNAPTMITLNGTQLPAITDSLNINGATAPVTISGNNASRLMSVNAGKTLTLRDLKLRDGRVTNTAGGAISNVGTLVLINCTVSNNTTSGSPGDGGALYNSSDGTTTLLNCTLASNTSSGTGGAVENNRGVVTLTNCTLSLNSAAFGGAVGDLSHGLAGSSTTLNNCTLAGNTANTNGGGVYISGSVTLNNTIVATNSSPNGPDIGFQAGNNVGGDYNLIGVADGLTLTGTHNRTGTLSSPLNARLGALANNGGLVDTIAIMPNSPALNGGSNALLPADTFDLDNDGNTSEALPFDARGTGFQRVQLGTTDIGAFEIQDSAPVAVNDSLTLAEDSSATPVNVRANDSDADGDTFTVTSVTQAAFRLLRAAPTCFIRPTPMPTAAIPSPTPSPMARAEQLPRRSTSRSRRSTTRRKT